MVDSKEIRQLEQSYYAAFKTVKAHIPMDEIRRYTQGWIAKLQAAEMDVMEGLRAGLSYTIKKAKALALKSPMAYLAAVVLDKHGYRRKGLERQQAKAQKGASYIPSSPVTPTHTPVEKDGMENREALSHLAQAEADWQAAVIAAKKAPNGSDFTDYVNQLRALGYNAAGKLVLGAAASNALKALRGSAGWRLCRAAGLPDGALAFQLAA